jgi:hypothetical protein
MAKVGVPSMGRRRTPLYQARRKTLTKGASEPIPTYPGIVNVREKTRHGLRVVVADTLNGAPVVFVPESNAFISLDRWDDMHARA